MRILVTGSRRWRDRARIAVGISDWLTSVGSSIAASPVPTVIHGAQRSWDPDLREHYGADWLADRVADNWGFTIERYPADWARGPGAGPLRNQHMVDLGADVCLAFPLGVSRGTRDCMDRAQAAGIRVVDLGEN